MASLIQQFPVELLISIFREIDDINDLRSLVLSCSTFYQAFLTDRHNILPPLMNKWYEKKRNIAQAIAAVRSKGLYAEIKSNYHEIVAILDTCRRSDEIEQSASAHILLPETPGNVEETIELLKLSKEAEFLQDFCMNLHPGQAAYWLRPGQWESEILPLKLSDTEKGRLLRAYYRVQTYSNMFGAPEWLPDEPRDSRCLNNWCWGGSSLVDEVYRLFFTTMPQWEAQEFCKSCLGVLRVLPYPPEYLNTQILEERGWDETLLGYASIGPSFLYKVLHEQYPERGNILARNIHRYEFSLIRLYYRASTSYYEFSLIHLEDFPDMEILPLLHPSTKYLRRNLKAFLNIPPPLEQPNLAWKWGWVGPNEFNSGHLRCFLRWFCQSRRYCRWGYAIWDDEIIQAWFPLTVSGGRDGVSVWHSYFKEALRHSG